MTTIKANCESCGVVKLGVGDLVVRVCADTDESTYTFSCPVCSARVTHAVEAHLADVLVSHGVELVVWRLPAELRERPAGPPLDFDDLLAFHELLERDDWFEQLISA